MDVFFHKYFLNKYHSKLCSYNAVLYFQCNHILFLVDLPLRKPRKILDRRKPLIELILSITRTTTYQIFFLFCPKKPLPSIFPRLSVWEINLKLFFINWLTWSVLLVIFSRLHNKWFFCTISQFYNLFLSSLLNVA